MPEDNEVLGAVARYEGNTQKTSDHDTIMYLYFENIDKNDNNTQRTIYESIDECYFGGVKLFPREFTNLCKNHQTEPKKFQLISRRIKKNNTGRKFICAGGED